MLKKREMKKKVKLAIKNITQACSNNNENLLELAVIAAQHRATLGEKYLLLVKRCLGDIKQIIK